MIFFFNGKTFPKSASVFSYVLKCENFCTTKFPFAETCNAVANSAWLPL